MGQVRLPTNGGCVCRGECEDTASRHRGAVWRRDTCDFLRSLGGAWSFSSCPRCWRPVPSSSTTGRARARPGRTRRSAQCSINRFAPGVMATARLSPMPVWPKGKDTASCVTVLAAAAAGMGVTSRRFARVNTLRSAPGATGKCAPSRMHARPAQRIIASLTMGLAEKIAVPVSRDAYGSSNARGDA